MTSAAVRRWALWVSLAANVFLLALVAAPLLRPHHPPGFAGLVEHLSRSLPPGDAERFRGVLVQERPWYDMARRRMDGSRAELSRAIAASPYDEARVRAAMKDWQASWQEMTDRFGDSLLLAISNLSPDGRARLADAAEHPPR